VCVCVSMSMLVHAYTTRDEWIFNGKLQNVRVITLGFGLVFLITRKH